MENPWSGVGQSPIQSSSVQGEGQITSSLGNQLERCLEGGSSVAHVNQQHRQQLNLWQQNVHVHAPPQIEEKILQVEQTLLQQNEGTRRTVEEVVEQIILTQNGVKCLIHEMVKVQTYLHSTHEGNQRFSQNLWELGQESASLQQQFMELQGGVAAEHQQKAQLQIQLEKIETAIRGEN